MMNYTIYSINDVKNHKYSIFKILRNSKNTLNKGEKAMDIEKILSKVDHTNLSQIATWDDIKQLCDDGVKYKVASICIPPCFVKQASEYLKGKLPICTVIGFPNGYNKSIIKCFEASQAVKDGADEIDMVININKVKEGKYNEILKEINAVKDNCEDKILKVIIEACLLTDEEKIKMCKIVSKSNADFIKTSTGFSSGGATPYDIELMKIHMSNDKKIKAAGGIQTLEDAEKFISLGADRLGTSKIVKIVKK